MTVRKVEIEGLSVTSSQPFEVVVSALKAAVGRPDNDLGNEILDAVSASLGSADAGKEQRTNDNLGEIHG
jgi:hypothetical protein